MEVLLAFLAVIGGYLATEVLIRFNDETTVTARTQRLSAVMADSFHAILALVELVEQTRDFTTIESSVAIPVELLEECVTRG